MIPTVRDEKPSNTVSFLSPFTIVTDDQRNGVHLVTYPDCAPHLELEIVRKKPVSDIRSLSPVMIGTGNQSNGTHLVTHPGSATNLENKTAWKKIVSASRLLSPFTITIDNHCNGTHLVTDADGEQHLELKIVPMLPAIPGTLSSGKNCQTNRIASKGKKLFLRDTSRRLVVTGKSTRRIKHSRRQGVFLRAAWKQFMNMALKALLSGADGYSLKKRRHERGKQENLRGWKIIWLPTMKTDFPWHSVVSIQFKTKKMICRSIFLERPGKEKEKNHFQVPT